MSEFRRQHPVAAIAQLLAVLKQNIVTIIILFFVGTRNSGDYFWYFFGFGILSALVIGFFSWMRFTYRVEGDELQINKGIFVRKKLYLTKDRIQVIDITEGLLQRAFGLVKVEIKSAGSGTESATISAITRSEAGELRKILRGESVSELNEEITNETEDQGQVKVVTKSWKLSSKDLVLAAFTSGNFGLIASILGAISGQMEEFINEENLNYLADKLPGYADSTLILWVALFIFIISYIISFIGVIFTYADFKLERNEKEMIITSGLLERKHTTVPYNRIQAVRFVEGIFRQPFGYGMLYVESAGFEQQNKEKSIVLLPFVSRDMLPEFFNEFLPNYYEPEALITPPERSILRYIRRPAYVLFVVIPVIWFLWEPGWMLFSLLIPAFSFGWLRFNDARLNFDGNVMKLQYRVLARTTAFIQKNRAQVTQLTINPFQRRKKLATIQLTAASGAGGINFSISDLDYEDAMSVYKWSVEDKDEYHAKFPSG